MLIPLQWGRDREVMDSDVPNETTSNTVTLQWGRDREVTDSRLLPHGRARYRRFNGAATARSRIDITRAQAELLYTTASMGPRPRGHG